MQIVDDWCDWLRAGGAAESTVTLRRKTLSSLVTHANTTLEAIAPMDLARWLGSQRAQWTRSTYYRGATAFYTWLELTGQRADNPGALLPRPRSPRGIPQPIETAVLRRMLLTPTSGRSLAYITLAAFAGLRVHEIAKMHTADVEGAWIRVIGKGGHTAMVPMHERVQRLADGYSHSRFWFPGRVDGHVGSSSVSRSIKSAMIRAGAPATAHAHSARHWYGTELMRATGDLRVVSELMRHANIQSTVGYTHVADDRRLRAIGKLRA